MHRSYRVQDKTVHVEELSGVVAAKFADAASARRARSDGALWQEQELEPALELDLPLHEVAPLEAAGWVLMRPSERPVEGTGELSVPLALGRLYREEGSGELMINVGRLTVRLRDELDTESALAALARHGLEIKRRLGFKPNLFEVEALDRSALEIAGAAADDDDYHYAEPQMIRKLGHR